MVKSILSVAHLGLRDWIVQRLSALFMTFYFLGLFLYLLYHPGLSFAEWHYLFSHLWMKVATLLLIFLLVKHTWVGLWTIMTDYVKQPVLRLTLECIVLLLLFSFFIWGFLILWSVT